MSDLDAELRLYRLKTYKEIVESYVTANGSSTDKNNEIVRYTEEKDRTISKALDDKTLDTDALLQVVAASRKEEWDYNGTHIPWELYRVIPGHTGWVNCLDVDNSNEWFATGSDDRLIKIWDLATGELRLSLSGHIGAVTSLRISDRHPYLFSVADDNMVKCWDLNMNRVVRHYHGHLNGVYTIDLHPSLDLLVTAGRDAVLRVWDMRTRTQVHILEGHSNTVAKVLCQNHEPQILSGSHDKTVRSWDLSAGKCETVLTHHKKAVKGLVAHPSQYKYASAAADDLKTWKGRELSYDKNVQNVQSTLNCIIAYEELDNKATIVGGGDTGVLYFWDWDSGKLLNTIETPAQPGSLDAENSILDMKLDKSETRLLTCGMDKTIKCYIQSGS